MPSLAQSTDERIQYNATTLMLLDESPIVNPIRFVGLIKKAINALHLDLSGLTVLTEAASGPYVCTPVIAALAGAKRVIAVTRDSKYGTASEVTRLTRTLEQLCGTPKLCGTPRGIEILTTRTSDIFADADIVTNLGFVRPIDSHAAAVMKPTTVVTLMCEAWEYRDDDVDVDACRRHCIRVFATNEEYSGSNVFSYSGLLCLKMLFDAGIEIQNSAIIVASGDKFGTVIAKRLLGTGASIRLVPDLRRLSATELRAADALVVADYCRDDTIIGPTGDLCPEVLAEAAPHLTVVQFAGRLDVQALKQHGVAVYPGVELGPHRMAMTLAALGPRPVIELHTAGLKVGEIVSSRSRHGSGHPPSPYDDLVQPLTTRAAYLRTHQAVEAHD